MMAYYKGNCALFLSACSIYLLLAIFVHFLPFFKKFLTFSRFLTIMLINFDLLHENQSMIYQSFKLTLPLKQKKLKEE